MKNAILSLTLLIAVSATTIAQTGLAKDQNPRFEESRDKYMNSADSINAFHSTTIQETYKAIDYLIDRAEAREQRRAFRRELRLERARNGWYDGYGNNGFYDNGYGYYNNGFYNNGYYNNGFYGSNFYGSGFYRNGRYLNNGYRNGYYRNSYYRNNGFYNRSYRNNYLWNTLPLAFTLAWLLN